MVYPDTFEGFAIVDSAKWSEAEKYEFEPKPFEDYDVDVAIDVCSICGSDAHAARNGWGKTAYPLVVGHEIIGKVVKVGSKVTNFKVGDRVGVGAQSQACLECKLCKSNNEIYCTKLVHTFGSLYHNKDGTTTKSQGGYSNYCRIHEYFVFPIPEVYTDEEAAPFLCAGITTYSPLVRNIPTNLPEGVRPKVGIVGLGGLGMMGIQFAKALGAETYVFSRTDAKKADAIALGAEHFIATENEGWVKEVEFDLDMILCTANSNENFDLNTYLRALKIGGKWVSVGLPESPFTVSPRSFMANACFMGASHLGSHVEMLEMFKLSEEKGIKPWVETLEASFEGVKEGLEKCHYNKCKYRVALSGFQKAFN
ncbi:hypothetical protein CANARDRAFT_9237 [[Candida] arabinofermentans NRRL YB-2248]|uniref:Enoyl reductase (ER) domain-containing protein n=1 Tax=[Candida] arabinofermentans NRRL YB-2248 TaxID=983967 RepID=A0A1E4SWX6_9ASCO|nr:hypothetical protein CANARDRAFT_9237 [[Candida] arabinofermentans NRRL YB-2248]